MKKSVVVNMQDAMEARPIAMLVQTANQYGSRIYLEQGSRRINAKSIMGMMSLSLISGDQITVVTEGEDEKKAADGIKAFFAEEKN